VKETATSYFKRLSDLLQDVQVTDKHGRKLTLDDGADKAISIILSVKIDLAKIMVIGNGGSAAIASHMQNDLCKAVGVRVLDFSQVPLLTALSNDHGYECVFERPIDLWSDSKDLLIAISSSGQSENILRATKVAVVKGCQIITLSGFNEENLLRSMGDVNFYVPSSAYGYVESTHSVLAHYITDYAVD